MCLDGIILDLGQQGRTKACETCLGTGVLTPQHICYCSLPCFYEEDGIFYCGLVDCLKNLKRDAVSEKALAFVRNQPSSTLNVHSRRPTTFGGLPQSNVSWPGMDMWED